MIYDWWYVLLFGCYEWLSGLYGILWSIIFLSVMNGYDILFDCFLFSCIWLYYYDIWTNLLFPYLHGMFEQILSMLFDYMGIIVNLFMIVT